MPLIKLIILTLIKVFTGHGQVFLINHMTLDVEGHDHNFGYYFFFILLAMFQ